MSSIDRSIDRRSLVRAGSAPKNNISSDTDEAAAGTTDVPLAGCGGTNRAF
jgi:hypothetical protein